MKNRGKGQGARGSGRAGQSSLEYMVVTAAIVGAIVVLGGPGGPLRAAWSRLVNGAVDKINQVAP